jgi:UDP-galactopyranose mutase
MLNMSDNFRQIQQKVLKTSFWFGEAMKKRIAVAGAGLSGAVVARELALTGRYRVDVFDSRDHVAGNCHSVRDVDTGIMMHVYGPHIFHTSNQRVWDYVGQFDEFVPFVNRVKIIAQGRAFSLPVNLLTINQFFGTTFSPTEARNFMAQIGEKIEEPRTFEEQALRFVGRELYEAFFKGYTLKQWGISPSELPASILKRLPVRFDYDDNYYASRFQGIPRHGYTRIVEKMLDHPDIAIRLNTSFSREDAVGYHHVFYSGSIDSWFSFCEGRLGYRTLDFVRESHDGDWQGNAVINYGDEQVPWTRIAEHKHFAPWEVHEKTVIFREFSRFAEEDDAPFYPVRLANDTSLLTRYVHLAEAEKNLTFIGRLGTYRYLDMHVAIEEALNVAECWMATEGKDGSMPVFCNRPF